VRGRVVRLVTGRVPGDGGGFTLACVAEEGHLIYIEPFLRDAVFGRGAAVRCDERELADGEGGGDGAYLDDADLDDADLTVVVDDRAEDASTGPGGLVLPLRVHMVADLSPGDGPGISARERKRQRHRVRSYAYDFEISASDSDFALFYDRMHVPTMRERHRDDARTTGRAEAYQDLFLAGFLLLVRSGGQPVAGILCRVQGRACHARLVGWLDGDPAHLRREAVKTGNHFLLSWARGTGFDAVNFQGGEPFLTKGTFQAKRHLGARAEIPGSALGRARVRLLPGRDSPVLRDILARNPAIAQAAGGRLAAVYFADAARPPRLDIPYACPGIEVHRLIGLDEFTGR
jgi:hypothetical protein